ncbi:restriction endonuclease subunit S [Klebsiella grimontii]|uniref:restriction endonuclease subunit S n=1 Tax=Klebsiella grimontii TaxID=2058152 RepID=UPI001914C31B|nr:restriction endonuclease subunit S [Klebsiella grimontii]
MVPEEWAVVEAHEICESIFVGVVIKPSQYYVEEKIGVKAFRSANVREGFINDSDWVYFSQEGHQANKKSHLKTGDVLIVRTGYPGTACVVTAEFEGANAIDIVIARPNKSMVVPEYLCAYTNSSVGKSQVLNLQGGMAQKHLNVGAYQTLKVKLPSLREQSKIVKIISTWEKAITLTENLLLASEKQKKAVMQQLISGRKRVLGAHKKWKFIKFNEAFRVVNKKSAQIKSNEYMETGNIPIVDQGKKLISGYCNSKVAYEDVPVIVFGDHTRCLKWVDFKFCPGADGTQVLTTTDSLDKKYGYYILCYTEIPNLGYSRHMRELKEKEFNVPSDIDEQKKIVVILTAIDQGIEILRQKIIFLKQEKKALMQQLLTGKRRVKTEVA